MYYELRTSSKIIENQEVTIQKASTFGRIFKAANDFLKLNKDRDALVYEVSEDDLDDVDLNKWSAQDMKNKEKLVKQFIWDDGDGGLTDA